jgi:hypothetical protein
MSVKYTLTVGTETTEHTGRAESIDEAKERSKLHRGEVILTDATGAETLTYRRGELSSYLWDDRR